MSLLSNLASLCKRRGVIFPSSEIYGGLSACWDYGPLGVQLKKCVQNLWWQEMTHRQDIVGLDTAILMHPRVWEASGHLKEFTDPLIDCKKCRFRFCHKDMGDESAPSSGKNAKELVCPKCGCNKLTEPRDFNLMFSTFAGAMTDSSDKIYLRPETAQGIYVNFLNVCSTMRKKLPFGVAQIGKAFRNEITVGHFIFRCREFEQMEMQYFVPPSKADTYFEYWKEQRKQFLLKMGLPEKSLREHEHDATELAHYAHKAVDLQFLFPMGWKELEGIHHRKDFDLKQHQQFSKKKLTYLDETTNTHYTPFVIESSIGLDRLILALLCSAYKTETVKNETRTVLALPALLSPVQIATLPLLQKSAELKNLTEKITMTLCKKWRVQYDERGSIGKRYRRQDEIGTPFCVTVDFESLKDHKVTVRHRDTMKQDRVSIAGLEKYLTNHIT